MREMKELKEENAGIPKDDWTELDELLKNRFAEECKNERDVMGLIMLSLSALECGLDDELIDYIKRNEHATSQDVKQYYYRTLLSPIEIVDDDELTEEERAD